MAKQLFKNNASSNISGSLTQGGTTLILASGTGDEFPTPTGGNYFLATIFEKDEAGIEEFIEVVKVTARTADTLTIVRDFESMTGQSGGFAYPSVPSRTVYVELRWTAAGADNMLQGVDNLAGISNAATARTNLGLGSVATHPSTDFASSTTTVSAGTGLSGGGDLSTNRTLNIADTSVVQGSYGSATQVGTFTVNAQGQLTYAGAVTITPGWSSITSTPTTLSGYGITDAQPLDADLTAIGALSGTSGLLKKTAANTWTLDTATYLDTTTAASTYQTQSGMSSYLTTATAASTYQTQSGMSSYLTTASAASTYQTQSGMSSYLTTASASTTYAALAGATFTGAVILSDQNFSRAMLKDQGFAYYNSGTTNALDYTNGSHQRWAPATGAQTLSITNWPPTGNLGELLIEGVNLGAATITWPTINWVKSDGTTTTTFASNGVTLQSSGTDWVYLWTRDAGTTIYGKVVR